VLARPHRLDDADGIYLKVQGRWCYLYRAIDRSGALVDVMFSEHCDMAAKAFFRSAKAVTGGGSRLTR
jgi:putative transposase